MTTEAFKLEGSRRPRSTIPKDHVCPEAYCGAGPFKNQAGLIGHMASKHRILYEKKETDGTNWYDGLPDVQLKLQHWHKFAMAKHVIYGISYKKLAEELGKSHESLRKNAMTEEGKAYLTELESQTDATSMVRNMLQSDSLNMYVDWKLAFGWAMENRDYDAVHRMIKDLGLKGIIGDESGQAPTHVTINLGGTDLAASAVKVRHEAIIEDADWTEEDDEEENA